MHDMLPTRVNLNLLRGLLCWNVAWFHLLRQLLCDLSCPFEFPKEKINQTNKKRIQLKIEVNLTVPINASSFVSIFI